MRLDVKVIPKSSRRLLKQEGGRWKALVTAPAEKGKANEAVIELAAEFFGVRKSAVRILKGAHSPNKTLEIAV